MKNNVKNWLVLILILTISSNMVQSSRRKFIWNWNQTNKMMPQYVCDSINNFFKDGKNDGVLFTLRGEGLYSETNNIDGIYNFRAFLSHAPKYMLVICNSQVYIIRSLSAEGICAEISRFIKKTNINAVFTQKLYDKIYEFLFNEYEAVEIQNNRKQQTVYFNSADEKLMFIRKRANERNTIRVAEKIKNNKSDIEDLPYYIITEHLYEESLILLFGILSNNIKYI